MQSGPEVEVVTGMDQRVKQAVAFIDEHLQTRLTVETVAADAGLSVSQFTRLFRQDVGSTPSAYVNGLRMERAALLLERTSLSVMEVMTQVGVTDPSHFARDFRRAHGFSPRAFRQHLRVSARPQWGPAPRMERFAHAVSTATADRRSGEHDQRWCTRTDRRRPGGD